MIFRGRRPAFPPRYRHPVVTIGMFDGVHRAHQALIHATVRLAHHLHTTSLAITFDPDPQMVLASSQAPPSLMPLATRLEYLQHLGLDAVWVIPFTRTFARVTAEQFVETLLIRQLQAKALVVGEQFMFGREAHGSVALLHTLGSPAGLRVVTLPQRCDRGKPISSSRIRCLIREGALTSARRLLGHPPALFGRVVRGVGRGHQLGFPTANLRLVPQVLPPRGVYAVRVQRQGFSSRSWNGVMNLGRRPTFGAGPMTCEIHLLRFSGTLRGESLSVALLRHLRPERTFPTPEALRHQIARDLISATRVFAHSS